MKAIHNFRGIVEEKRRLFFVPKIRKNESNSQQKIALVLKIRGCFLFPKLGKMKAIHNILTLMANILEVYSRHNQTSPLLTR